MKLISRTLAGAAVSVFAVATANAATSNVAAPSIDTVPAVELTTETVTLVAGANKIDCSKVANQDKCLTRRALRRNGQINRKTKEKSKNMKERLAQKRAEKKEALKERRENIFEKRAERKAKTRTHYHKQNEKHNP